MFYQKIFRLIVVFSLFYFDSLAQSPSAIPITRKDAVQWLEHGQWRKDLTVQPHASINAQLFATQYHRHKEWWDQAFAFLNRKDLAGLAPGNYPIAGENVYASISEYIPKDFDKSQWESHRKYADIQCMIKGEEKIGKAPVSALTMTVPYDAKKDAANYKGPGKYYAAGPGTFFIFFPGEGHRPNIKAGTNDTMMVKKIVIKMRVTD